MLGQEPSWFWKIMWAFVSPVFLLVIFISAIWSWKEHKWVFNPDPDIPEFPNESELFLGTLALSRIRNGRMLSDGRWSDFQQYRSPCGQFWTPCITLLRAESARYIFENWWVFLHFVIFVYKLQVVKPTSKWGPGDKAVRRQILDEMGGIPRVGKYAYDNNAMGYEAYYM